MSTLRCWLVRVVLFMATVFLPLTGSLAAQGIAGKLKRAAENTGIAREAKKLEVEAEMLDARKVDLEERVLPTLSVGSLVLGISAAQIKNGDGVRLWAYLFNPTATDDSVPVPDPELFTLVDQRGRRLERLGGVEVEDLPSGSARIEVPAYERVTLFLLFEGAEPGASTGMLKVGEIGVIPGIPVHTDAVLDSRDTTSVDVWRPHVPAFIPERPDTVPSGSFFQPLPGGSTGS